MDTNYDDLGIDLNKHIGFDFDHYDAARLPKLSAEDDEKWYSKFYYKGRTELPDSMTHCIQRGVYMDPKDAILPGDGGIDKLMDPGQIPGDNGYCMLPNGCSYAAVRSELPGVTLEMNNWYKKLRMVDKLSYMIWYPGSHYSELNGICHEDIGFGLERNDVESPANIKNLGFSCHPATKDPQFLALVGGNGWWVNLEYPEIRTRAMTLFHYIRRLPDDSGIEFRSHIYVGMFAENGQAVKKQNIQPDICLEAARKMADHAVYERENVTSFLPELFEKMQDVDLTPQGEVKESWVMETAPVS